MADQKECFAFDLDGTMAKRQEPFNPYSVGEPIKAIVDMALEAGKKGTKLLCFTARASSKDPKMLSTVRTWLDKQGLKDMKITNIKVPTITRFIDDRAVGVVPDKGVLLTEPSKVRKVSLDELLDASRKPKQAAKVVERNSNTCPHCSCQITSDADPRAHDDPEDCDDTCPSCGQSLHDKEAGEHITTHTKTLPDGRVLDVLKLLATLKDSPAEQLPLSSIRGPSRSTRSGFSQKRYDAVDTKLPGIVDQDNNMLDGRHRFLRHSDAGAVGMPVHRATPEQIEAAVLKDDEVKEAALRPLKERMLRLRARRGECFECGGLPHDFSGKPTTYQDCGAPFTPGEIPNSSPMDKSAHRRLLEVIPKETSITEAREKSASTQIETLTGPHGILQALKNLDVDALRKQANDDIASGKITRRDKGVKMLNALEGLRRNNIKPEELMIHRIPVLPPAFRPFAFLGNTYVPGDANELYQDIFKHRAVHDETLKTLGEGGAAMTRMNLLNATRALYGYGDPVSPKLKERAPAGYLTQILGDGPKFSFVQRRLLSKTIDNVGRSVITVDPDMDMNHSSIPRDMAWTIAGSAVQRRLAQMGMSPVEAIKAVKDRSREATQALEQHLKETPFLLGRSPAWHKFNNVGQYMSIHDGPHIAINPYIAAGLGADHDGDQVNVSLPVLPDSIQEAKDKLMPDKMLFSIKDPEKTVALPKHEATLGIWTASKRPSTKVTRFASGQEALAAMHRGDVKLHDEIEIPDAP